MIKRHYWRPDLVVVDTLTNYMGSDRDMHRQNEVGEFLATLNEMVEETGGAVLCVVHLNKSDSADPMFRIVGSIGFGASVRSMLILGRDPTDPARTALAHDVAP